eukprot:1785285-Rhodomonas_salina.1
MAATSTASYSIAHNHWHGPLANVSREISPKPWLNAESGALCSAESMSLEQVRASVSSSYQASMTVFVDELRSIRNDGTNE